VHNSLIRLECVRLCAIVLWSGLGHPSVLAGLAARVGTKVKSAALLHYRFRHPPDAVRESSTDGGQGKDVGCIPADGFAVLEGPPRACFVLHERGGEVAARGHLSDPHRFIQLGCVLHCSASYTVVR
jgi:hypothetical protein